jgi:hypothetical protein
MRRRRFLGLVSSAGTLSLAGCSGIFGDDDEEHPVDPKPTKAPSSDLVPRATPPPERPPAEIPEACPVSTIVGYEPPDQATRKAVESFIRAYEEAYMLEEQFLSYEDELTAATILSSEQTGYGYAIEAQFSGTDVFLQASVRAEPEQSGGTAGDLSVLDSQLLADVARRAAEGQAVVEGLSPPRGVTEAETLPRQLQEQIDALPSAEIGGYVGVEGTRVRIWVDVSEVHADYFTYSVLYYVDASVVRRQYLPESDAVARDGELVECRGP